MTFINLHNRAKRRDGFIVLESHFSSISGAQSQYKVKSKKPAVIAIALSTFVTFFVVCVDSNDISRGHRMPVCDSTHKFL